MMSACSKNRGRSWGLLVAGLLAFSLSSARATPTEHPKFHVEADKLHAYIAEKIETFQLNQNRFRLTLADSHLVTDFAFDVPVTGILCPDLEVLTQPKEDMRPWLQKFAQNRPLLCEIQLGSHTSKSLSIQTKITVESLVLTTVQAVAKGTPLRENLLQQSWKPFAYNDADWVHDMEDIPPQAVTKSELPEGASVKKSALFRPYSILRGQTTTLQITSGGLTLRSKVKALENGYLGEYATFTRSDTKKRLSAKIVSSDLVKME